MLSAEQREQVVNHLRAIRRAIEPDLEDDVAGGIRQLTAQGLIDSAIALLLPAPELPKLGAKMEGPFGGQIVEVETFDPFRRREA